MAPTGWYVVEELPNYRQALITGLELNELNEWDTNKLGWMKAGDGGKFVTASLEQLRNHFTPTVDSCLEGKYQTTFSSGEIDKGSIQGRRVIEEFPFLAGVRVWQRHVEMEHKESPLLSLTLQHRSEVGITVGQSSSSLKDFTGILYQDSLSHIYINLSLIEASGKCTLFYPPLKV